MCYDAKNDFCSTKFPVKMTPAEKQVNILENTQVSITCYSSSLSTISIAEVFQYEHGSVCMNTGTQPVERKSLK